MIDNLIAEDLMLLLLDDESGKFDSHGATSFDMVIGGALLVELALRGAIEVTEKQTFRQPKVIPTADDQALAPMLAEALEEVIEKDRTATALVSRLGKDRKHVLLDRLVAKGMIRVEKDKVLGLFPRTRWPAEDSAHETEVRRKINQAVIAERTTDERTAALISLVSSLGAASNVISIEGISRRDIKKRAKAISEGDWASKAVRGAVEASQAALVAVAVAASIGASS